MNNRHGHKKLTIPSTMTALILMVLFACVRPAPTRSSWQSISPDGWLYGDTLVYDLTSPVDSLLPMPDSLVIDVRHTDSYEYSNLWIEVRYPVRDTITADTFNLELANSFGHWQGHGNGVTFQFTDTLVLRQKPSAHFFKVRHIMRLKNLENIEQVGLSEITHVQSIPLPAETAD